MYSLLAIDTGVCTNGRVSCEGLSSPISKAMLYRLGEQQPSFEKQRTKYARQGLKASLRKMYDPEACAISQSV
jgi:hypothetical protein